VKSFRNQIAIEYFAQVCTAPMLSETEMLMNLSSKQKSLCQLATAELQKMTTIQGTPTIQGNSKKMTNARLGMMPLISGS